MSDEEAKTRDVFVVRHEAVRRLGAPVGELIGPCSIPSDQRQNYMALMRQMSTMLTKTKEP